MIQLRVPAQWPGLEILHRWMERRFGHNDPVCHRACAVVMALIICMSKSHAEGSTWLIISASLSMSEALYATGVSRGPSVCPLMLAVATHVNVLSRRLGW